MSAATPPCARSRANSRKPNSKMLSMPVALPRDSIARYSELRSPPDQKLFSKRSAARCARRTTMRLRKMIAQDISEAASRMPMTICTTRLACTIIRRIDISPPISYSLQCRRAPCSCRQLPDYDLRQAPGFQGRGIEAGDAYRGAQEQLALERCAPYALRKHDAGTALQPRLAADRQQIVEPRRTPVLRFQRHHREHHAGVARQRQLRHAARAQPLGARALQEAQVIRIIDNTPGVGVFPVDTRLPDEGNQAPSPNNGRLAAARSGIFMPKYCQL